MKNRAKCKLCQSVIESYFKGDYVSCKCGEISVTDGEALNCAAKDFENFLRVDDEGNEIVVTVKTKMEEEDPVDKDKLDVVIEMLDHMGQSIENLPSHALSAPVSHYDLLSLVLVLSSSFKELKARSERPI